MKTQLSRPYSPISTAEMNTINKLLIYPLPKPSFKVIPRTPSPPRTEQVPLLMDMIKTPTRPLYKPKTPTPNIFQQIEQRMRDLFGDDPPNPPVSGNNYNNEMMRAPPQTIQRNTIFLRRNSKRVWSNIVPPPIIPPPMRLPPEKPIREPKVSLKNQPRARKATKGRKQAPRKRAQGPKTKEPAAPRQIKEKAPKFPYPSTEFIISRFFRNKSPKVQTVSKAVVPFPLPIKDKNYKIPHLSKKGFSLRSFEDKDFKIPGPSNEPVPCQSTDDTVFKVPYPVKEAVPFKPVEKKSFKMELPSCEDVLDELLKKNALDVQNGIKKPPPLPSNKCNFVQVYPTAEQVLSRSIQEKPFKVPYPINLFPTIKLKNKGYKIPYLRREPVPILPRNDTTPEVQYSPQQPVAYWPTYNKAPKAQYPNKNPTQPNKNKASKVPGGTKDLRPIKDKASKETSRTTKDKGYMLETYGSVPLLPTKDKTPKKQYQFNKPDPSMPYLDMIPAVLGPINAPGSPWANKRNERDMFQIHEQTRKRPLNLPMTCSIPKLPKLSVPMSIPLLLLVPPENRNRGFDRLLMPCPDGGFQWITITTDE